MSIVQDRDLYFNPVSGELRFDHDYEKPANIPAAITWPMNKQRQNKEYGFKNLTLTLTMRCNLACDYCWQHRDSSNDIQRKTIDKWLDFFLDNKINSPNKILYYGGEPLLRMNLIEYASNQMKKLCKSRGMAPVKQHIFTNATLLTDENIEILQREHIFLILSVDGAPKVNALHRHSISGSSVDSLIIDGVKRLQNRGIKYGVCCTLSDVEFDVESTVGFILDEFRPYSIELNLRHDANFCQIANTYKGQKLESFCSAWDRIRAKEMLNVDLRKRITAIVDRVPLQNSSSGSKNKLAVMPDGKISSFNGAVSYPELQIDPDGEWIQRFRDRWNRNVLINKKCQSCRAAYICGQGSAFSSYLQYGDFMHAPALHCEYCNTMLDYILDVIRNHVLQRHDIPDGYVVTPEDIKSAFPTLFQTVD